MNEKQIATDVLKGRKLVVLEARKVEIKETGTTPKSPLPIPYVAITSLAGDDTVEVSLFPPRGTKRDAIVLPKFDKGQRIVVEFSEWNRSQYGTRVRAISAEPITA